MFEHITRTCPVFGFTSNFVSFFPHLGQANKCHFQHLQLNMEIDHEVLLSQKDATMNVISGQKRPDAK
jgi:hypothetical protein